MDTIERLSSLFAKFPGIGPRQAGRFVQFLLRNASARRELVELAQSLGSAVRQCPRCFRYHAGKEKLCDICTSDKRDQSLLAIVATDADLMALERSGTFKGHYLVLGGTMSLATERAAGLRLKELAVAAARPGLSEIVLAFPANPEGDATAGHVRHELEDLELAQVKITTLGRGLSTGSELEYADQETLKSAFDNRK